MSLSLITYQEKKRCLSLIPLAFSCSSGDPNPKHEGKNDSRWNLKVGAAPRTKIKVGIAPN
jgi:hypothetical protein